MSSIVIGKRMKSPRLEQETAGAKPRCLQCDGIELRRQGRFGFWQRVIAPHFGLFPWECGLCRKIYMLRQRSTGYRQHSVEARVLPLPLELVQTPAGTISIAPARAKNAR